MRCEAIVVGTGEQCEKQASLIIKFPDNVKTPVCENCAINLQQIAEGHHSKIQVVQSLTIKND